MLAVKVGQQTTAENQPEKITSRELGKPSLQNEAVNVALISSGKQVLTQGISQYADFTGDYTTSQTFNSVMSIGADLLTLATGPIGWIAVGTKTALNITESIFKQQDAIRSLEFIKQRAGYISTQGSRYQW